ncbi:MAG: hypothetical protein CMJ58_13745 [Planctomycetaceae bacterium]|nr:hypothetical protein [Planctomycetaceae bacterium]
MRRFRQSTTQRNGRRGRTCRFESLEPRALLAGDTLAAARFEVPLAPPAEVAALGEISGQVYQLDANAVDQGGIAAVELTLLDETGTVVGVTRTAADGSYRFANLSPGLYAVQQRQPAGFVDGPESIGLAGGQVLTDDLVGEIPLAAGQVASGYDFAEYRPPDAPAPTADGLPRLILAGGGVSGPGGSQALATPAQMDAATPSATVAPMAPNPMAAEIAPGSRAPSAESDDTEAEPHGESARIAPGSFVAATAPTDADDDSGVELQLDSLEESDVDSTSDKQSEADGVKPAAIEHVAARSTVRRRIDDAEHAPAAASADETPSPPGAQPSAPIREAAVVEGNDDETAA